MNIKCEFRSVIESETLAYRYIHNQPNQTDQSTNKTKRTM